MSLIFEATEDNIAKAADRLAAGGLVAMPTETVYGLVADATNDRAVASIFAAKGRPTFNPVIVHFRSKEEAAEAVVFNHHAELLAALHKEPGRQLDLDSVNGMRTVRDIAGGLCQLPDRLKASQ